MGMQGNCLPGQDAGIEHADGGILEEKAMVLRGGSQSIEGLWPGLGVQGFTGEAGGCKVPSAAATGAGTIVEGYCHLTTRISCVPRRVRAAMRSGVAEIR